MSTYKKTMENISTMLVVSNLKIAKQFYVKVLGLNLCSEHSDRIHLNVGGYEIVIFQGDGPAIESKHGSDANSTLIFTTKNLDEKIEKLKLKGVQFLHDIPNTDEWGRYCAFKDPSGITHELFEPTPVK